MWTSAAVRGFLLDITGVLIESGGAIGTLIPGSVEAVARLRAAGISVRFVTNETTCSKALIVKKLRKHGFVLQDSEVFPPAPAVVSILKKQGLRPHLLVHPDLKSDFNDVDVKDPNCVVIGDPQDQLTYDTMNKAFRVLLDHPKLYSLGFGKFYKENNKLTLDVGAFARALEYSADVKAEVVGKPSQIFFQTAVQDMNLQPSEVVMVGDDILSDVGGAQKSGLRGILVRTGKFRPSDENHPTIKPDVIVDNLAQAVDQLLEQQK